MTLKCRDQNGNVHAYTAQDESMIMPPRLRIGDTSQCVAMAEGRSGNCRLRNGDKVFSLQTKDAVYEGEAKATWHVSNIELRKEWLACDLSMTVEVASGSPLYNYLLGKTVTCRCNTPLSWNYETSDSEKLFAADDPNLYITLTFVNGVCTNSTTVRSKAVPTSSINLEANANIWANIEWNDRELNSYLGTDDSETFYPPTATIKGFALRRYRQGASYPYITQYTNATRAAIDGGTATWKQLVTNTSVGGDLPMDYAGYASVRLRV